MVLVQMKLGFSTAWYFESDIFRCYFSNKLMGNCSDGGGGGGSNGADCNDPHYCSDCDGCSSNCCPNYCSGNIIIIIGHAQMGFV